VAAACGGGGGKTTTPTTAAKAKQVGLVFDLGGRGDKSFNDAAARGLDKAKTEFNLTTKELEPAAGGQNREELLRLLTSQKYPLVFAIGFLFADSVKAVSADNPDTMYAIVDSAIPNPNVASLLFAEEEGSYLVGAAAALKSKTHHIGFIGGVDTDLIKKFEAGYVAGAKKIDPGVQIDIKYISQPPDFTGFNDPAKGKEIGLGMYNAGADVVYHAAGGSGTGLFDAAVDATRTAGAQKWAIGVDSDQYLTATTAQKAHVLTSMLKRVDVAVYDTAKAYAEGTLKAGTTVFDLKADGVGYATSGGYVDDIKAQLEDLKQQIISGKIAVLTQP
jgi:basic membrane protein A